MGTVNDTAALTVQVAQPLAMPIMDIRQALQRREQMVQFVRAIMNDGTDYGTIPGTGNKPTLLKPGAEKLTTFFGLHPVFVIVEKAEDWTGKDHDGEPFLYYLYKCQLWRMGEVMAEGDGSCSSRESKYRYRQGERKCPNCGKPAIIKGKAEYGGGWICFGKKGGCGAKFRDGDKSIEGQDVGRVVNPDVADQANTILKMAQKRALVAAVLIGVNASEYFTQDLEDLAEGQIIDVTPTVGARVLRDTEPPSSPPPDSERDWQEQINSVPQAGRVTPPASNGDSKRKPPTIKTAAWAALGADLAARCPYWQTKDKDGNPTGKFNGDHAANALAKSGTWTVINDANVADAMQELLQYAEAQQQPAA